MKKLQQAIKCESCGDSRLALLMSGDAKAFNDVAGPIYRDCIRCGKITGWTVGLRQSATTSNASSISFQSKFESIQVVDSYTINGQERIATQAERDKVNLMVQSIESPS
ncbi:MAG: hypothetical protein JST85_05070 [Acidobacteria bacterium]|nr:hypothetical protein [Acidobacteriota bacterium]